MYITCQNNFLAGPMTQNLPFIYVDADPRINFPEQGLLVDVVDPAHMRVSMALPHPICMAPDPEHITTAKGLIDNIAYLCKIGARSATNFNEPSPFQRSYTAGTHKYNRKNFSTYAHLIYNLDLDFDAGNTIEDIVSELNISEKSTVNKAFYDFQAFEKPKNLKKRHNTNEVQAIMKAGLFVGMTQNLPEFKNAYNAQKYDTNDYLKYTIADRLVWNTSLLFRKSATIYAIQNNITTLTKRDKRDPLFYNLITTASATNLEKNYRCGALSDQLDSPLAWFNNLQFASKIGQNGQIDLEKHPNLGRKEAEKFALMLGEFAQNYDKNHALNQKKVFPMVKSSLTNPVNSYNTKSIQPGGQLQAS